MKKPLLMLLIVVLVSSSYIVLGDTFRVSGGNQNVLLKDLEFLRKGILDEPPMFAQNLTLRVNATDDENNIEWVNFTLIAPDGATVVDNLNGTKFSDWWNSTYIIINQSGTWKYNITSTDNNTLNTTIPYITGTFNINDNLHASKNNITTVIPVWYNLSYDIEFWSDTRENLTFILNHTMDTNFTVSLNVTTLVINSTRYKSFLRFNISSNSTSEEGIHTGNLSITRQAPFDKNFTIPITIEISSSYGDIEFVEPVSNTNFVSCGGEITHSYNVTNLGNYDVTDCLAYLYDENNNEVSTTNAFDLGVGLSYIASATYVYGGSSSIITHFGVRCIASPSGSYDFTTNDAEVLFSPAEGCGGGGGGGGGGPSPLIQPAKVAPPLETPKKEEIPGICGNFRCEPDEGETPWNCQSDCLNKLWELDRVFCSPFPNCGNWFEEWFINLIMIIVMGGFVLFITITQKTRRLTND